MFTLRLTHKLRKILDVDLSEHLQPTTSRLGDWYANFVPTCSGDLIVFVNERTLLSVAVPIWEADHLYPLFRMRLGNLLSMIGLLPGVVSTEIHHHKKTQFSTTKSRNVIGSMNDIGYQYQFFASIAKDKKDLSLSDMEIRLSQMPSKLIDYRIPADLVEELLA